MTANDRVKYATYRRDAESSLDYAGNRYYSNVTGRFMSADPYWGERERGESAELESVCVCVGGSGEWERSGGAGGRGMHGGGGVRRFDYLRRVRFGRG